MINENKTINKQPLQVSNLLNTYFNHIYVVNLEFKIVDRLMVSEHLKKHGIDFEIFSATDGYSSEVLKHYKEYQKRELGDLKRYSQYAKREQIRGHAFIDSAGAMGYIYTYLNILKDAKKNGYKRFLILEDDILLSNDFENKFKNFIQNIDNDWKILQLGATQYGWDSIDLQSAEEKGFYFPVYNSDDNYTYGSFAIAFDSTVVDELIEAEGAFEASFDFLPMEELYKKYSTKCFVAYPNLVIADVSSSSIRNSKCQYTEGSKRKWILENFDYPLNKPSISILITSKRNLKYYSTFSKTKELPFNLRLFLNASDSLHPVQATTLPNIKMNKTLPQDNKFYITESNYSVTIDENENLTENYIVKFIEYKLGIKERNETPLIEIKTHKRSVQKERISVILPICKKPKNLKNTLLSVIEQDYHNIELIVVCDNEIDSKFTEKIKELISFLGNKYSNCSITLLEYSGSGNLSAARNAGIFHSTGEFICFLNDGDIYLSGRLSKSIDKLKITKKTVGAIYCGYIEKSPTEEDLSYCKAGDLTLEVLLSAFKKPYLYISTVTYKRDAILCMNGFDESYRHYQDFEFHLRYFELYTIEHSKECLVQLGRYFTIPDNQTEDLIVKESKRKFLCQFSYKMMSALEIQNESLKGKKELHIRLKDLSTISFFRHPIMKIKRYKKLMKTFYG